MEFEIHPAQVGWLEALTRGEKVLYHSAMRFLYCFSPTFNPMGEPYICHWIFPGMHELIYPFKRDRGVVGVVFCCLGGLLRDTDLISTQDAEGNLSPLSIFEYGIQWLEQHSGERQQVPTRPREEVTQDNDKVAAFLRQYPLLIPHHVWKQALPVQSS